MEAELLRIAQEAVTNARRHAGARNLWVSCTINPPAAQLSIVDDGRGMGRPRPDSFGMEVMRERAERIGGVLQVAPREGGGTVVTATVNPDRLAKSEVRGSA
jgi:signal transduction histidine kinase